MKKFTKVFFVICLMLALVASLVACATSGTQGKDDQGRFILATPKVELDGGIVTWSKVRYCEKYGVKINDEEEFETTSRMYSIGGESNATIKVRAIGDNVKTVSSDYCEPIGYSAKGRLDTPTNLELKVTESSLLLTWDSVDGAATYKVKEIHNADSANITHTTSTNSLEIAITSVNSPNIYRFTVRAESTNSFYSAYSEEQRYEVKEKLETPKVVLKDTITWNEVASATNYRVYLQKIGDSVVGEDMFLVTTLSSGSRSYNEGNLSSAITSYKKDWEKRNEGKTFDISGDYKLFIQAIHRDHPEIYLDSELAEVKKGEESGEAVTFKKPSKIQGINIKTETIGADDKQTDVDMLIWDKLDDFNNYRITFYSNDSSVASSDKKLTTEEGETKLDITTKFKGDPSHIGKVMNISIYAMADFANGVLVGEETFYMDVDNPEVKVEYIPKIVTGLDTEEANNDFKGYKKIENLGGLLYMMEHAVAGEKYYLANEIDGGNCNFYVNVGAFNALFDGNNKIIKNINFIVKDSATGVSLFTEIASGAEFKNVTFNDIKITCDENKKYEYVALLAKTNNGTIKNVFLINSNFETNCNTAGFVINNAGSISGAGFLDTDITATGFADSETESSRLGAGSVCDVAGIAINNTGTIFNASVYSSQIIAESLLVDVKAGGIAVNNSGNITNSFLRKCLVKAETTASTESQVSSIAGGIVAINSGLISDCYVENDGTSSRTVVATTGINGQADRYAIAGGIVGRMIGGEIKACYVYRVAINATRRVGGLVAEVPSAELGNVKITNCYVLRVGFSTAQERAMILADKLADGNVENVYCVLLDYTSIDTSNAIVVELSKLSELNIDGFIYDANYSERLSLKNMLYAKKYSVDYSKGANRDRDLVYAVENLNGTKALFECDLTSSGKKVDIYSYTINSGTDYAQEIILPIYVNVK